MEQLWLSGLTPLSDFTTNEYEIIKLSFISEVLGVLRGQPFGKRIMLAVFFSLLDSIK